MRWAEPSSAEIRSAGRWAATSLPATEHQFRSAGQFRGNSLPGAQTRQTHPGAAEPMPFLLSSLWRPGRAPALSVSLVRPLLILICLLALGLPMPAAWAADRDRDEEPYADLPQSVRRIERETGGKVLQVRPIRRGDREIYRMKVLTPDGRIKIMQDDPRRRRDARNRDQERDPERDTDDDREPASHSAPPQPEREERSLEPRFIPPPASIPQARASRSDE